jgi:hypothetical protein
MNLMNKPPLGLKAEPAPKNPRYLAAVRELPCCICDAFGEVQQSPTAAHHVFSERWGTDKTPDEDAIPLCWHHHQGPMGIHNRKESWVAQYGADRDFTAATQDKLARYLRGEK